MKENKICVIIPVFNESMTIGHIVESIRKKDIDVIIVDDGSTDNSGDIALSKGAKDVIIHEDKKGKGYSLREGFSYAIEHNYDGVITMDGDGQHDIYDIDSFIDASNHYGKPCIINGNRMKDVKRMPFVRYITNRFMSVLISLFTRQNIPDSQCGYKYISCDILRSIVLSSNDFEIETEVLMKALKKGFKIYPLNIKTIYGKEKSKINPFKDTIRFIFYFIKEIFS